MINHPLLPPFLLNGAMSNPLKGCRVSGQVMLTSANLSLLFQGETPTKEYKSFPIHLNSLNWKTVLSGSWFGYEGKDSAVGPNFQSETENE